LADVEVPPGVSSGDDLQSALSILMLIPTLLLWLATASAGPAPHLGPPIWAELSIEEERVIFTLSGEPTALKLLLGSDVNLVGPLEEDELSAARAIFEELLEREAPLSIGGVPVTGELREFEIPIDDYESSGWLIVNARYVVDVESAPRAIGVRWSTYEGAVWQGESFIPLTILRGRRVSGQALLHPEEPEYVWHPAPDDEASKARAMDTVRVEREPELWTLPLLSIGLAAGAILLFVGSRRVPERRAAMSGVAFVLLLASATLHETGTVSFRSPLEEVVAQPSPDQARAIFESLHRNIYDAFLAETEDEIYDLLEVSVDAALLDELYGDIYESLILREQGGAVCAIESISNASGSVSIPTETGAALQFQVDWSWEVNGLVSHWGHMHRRRNEYEADYTVGHDGVSWKIQAVDVREHRRVDLPDPVISLEGDAAEDLGTGTRRK